MKEQIKMLQNILEALMTINTRGNDTITMSNVLQALQNVITEIRNNSETEQSTAVVEPEIVNK